VAPHNQRTASAYIFGAICPQQGKGAALVLPRCNSAAMSLHLAEIAACVAPGAHAVLMLDQAGWHLSDKLVVPPNLTLLARLAGSAQNGQATECCANERTLLAKSFTTRGAHA
jgi:hypothetical protein